MNAPLRSHANEAVRRATPDDVPRLARLFTAVFAQYQKAPDVTRQRILLETLTEVLPKVGRKIILDEKGQQVLPFLQLQAEK